MKCNQNTRILTFLYSVISAAVLMSGFTSTAAEKEVKAEPVLWDISQGTGRMCSQVLEDTQDRIDKAYEEYLLRLEEQRKAEEEALRLAQEQAERQAADRELLAALIFCEAGNQPYEGQVAVGAVVMNRVKSGLYPNSIREVIYQSGQFTPAVTGWLDRVLQNKGYTDSAKEAAQDALEGANPVGGCLYFSTGGQGMQIGDHFFR